MKSRKHVFFNRQQLLLILTAVVFLWLGVIWISEGGDGFWFGTFFLLLACAMLPAFLLFFPNFYLMDSRSIRIYYCLFYKEEIPWSTVSSVELEYAAGGGNYIPYFLDRFVIHGKPLKKPRFFMKSAICRTHRGRRLIEAYTGRRIEGYLSEDIKGWLGKKKTRSTAVAVDRGKRRRKPRRKRKK